MDYQELNEKLFVLQMKLAMTKRANKDITPIKEEIEQYQNLVKKILEEQKGVNQGDQHQRK